MNEIQVGEVRQIVGNHFDGWWQGDVTWPPGPVELIRPKAGDKIIVRSVEADRSLGDTHVVYFLDERGELWAAARDNFVDWTRAL